MNDAQFDQFLKSRTAIEPVPASFRREVWGRIEASRKPSWFWNTGFWNTGFGKTGFGTMTAFLKQSVAGAACVGVALGLWLGSARPDDATKVAYLESINPLSHLHQR